MTVSTPSPASEYVTFIQHQLPGLGAGSYQLDISQHVNDSAGQPVSVDPLSRSYTFAVTGDRFRLSNPSATVASTFPASNATGEYSTVLAHVVFAAPAFPWSRSPARTPPPLPPPGQDRPGQGGPGSESDVPTWLAVLVLDDDDAAAYPGLDLEPVTASIGDFFPPALYGPSTLGENYSYFADAKTVGLEAGETVTDPVQIIDIPLQLFTDVAPSLGELSLSAHVRKVSVENKPMAPGATAPADPIGTFAIVVGNRLPQADKRSHGYLVSLEALEEFLPATSEGGVPANSALVMTRTLRLAVLSHWTFYTKGEPSNFTERLELLNGRTAGGSDAGNTNLRLEVAGASPPVSVALDAGYVPLNHDLRTGETTVSWYRGPLSTIDRARAPVTLPISAPDQALAFDPTTGMFDASLAAAWTIGRLAALQDQSYAASLYAWKKGLTQAVADAVEREIIDEVLAGLFPQAVPEAVAQARAAARTEAARPSAKTLLHETMRLITIAGAR